MAASSSPKRSSPISAPRRSAEKPLVATAYGRKLIARLKAIREQHPEVDPLKVAFIGVSGGRDSMALAHFLISSGWKKLVVAHLDHGLRGRASRGDAAFVRKFAEAHGLRCEIEAMKVAAFAKQKKLSVETAARDARRDFFQRLAKKHRCRVIFLAHHAEDQAETVLQHFFRGSALHGVSGMPPVAALGKSLLLARPALEASRRDIDEYIAAFGLEYREDASNASREFTRNRVRHELLPLLDDIFCREVSPLITRFAEHARLDEDLARSLADGFVESENSIDADGSLEITAKFRELHPALRGRILHRWLTARSTRIGSREIQAALAMLKPGAARTFSLPGGVHLRHDGRRFWLEPAAKSTLRKPKSPRSSKRC